MGFLSRFRRPGYARWLEQRIAWRRNAYPVPAAPPSFALLTTLYDRQVGMYQVVLEQGAARGIFALGQPSLVIARNLVALEDAYGYRIIAQHPTIDHDAALGLIVSYARLATGHALTSSS